MTEKTSSKKRRKYDSAFKAEVLKMVASGRPVSEISQALGIGENIVYRWQSKPRQVSTQRPKGEKEVAVWQQIDPLREKRRETEMECAILKKAWSIFSRMT